MPESDEQAHAPSVPIEIADASLPVDGGLSGLGLIMSLSGGLFQVIAIGAGTMMVLSMLMAGGNLRGAGTVLLIALAVITTSTLRSWAHRAAGQRLLYDGPGTPRSAMRRYFVLSAVQLGVVILALGSQGAPPKILGLLFVMLAGWPAALAIVLASGRFRALLDHQTVPHGEDRGFEGAAILMVVLGLTGLLFGVVMAIVTLEQFGPMLEYAPVVGLCLITIVTMMILRSSLHVRAGVRGVLEAHSDRAVSSVAKYSNFAVLAGALISGFLFLMMLVASEGHQEGPVALIGIVTVVFLMWSLAIWPLILKRFIVERQFTDFAVNEAAPRRAPDRGLATLGWFLFGQAVLGLSMALPALVLAGPMDPDDYHRARDPMSQMFAAFQAGGRAQWWSIGAAALQLVASWQLIRMRANHKVLVTVWGAAATLVAVYINYPVLEAMTKGGIGGAFGDSTAMLGNVSFIAVAISLIAPIATLVLVNRKQRDLPTAVLHR